MLQQVGVHNVRRCAKGARQQCRQRAVQAVVAAEQAVQQRAGNGPRCGRTVRAQAGPVALIPMAGEGDHSEKAEMCGRCSVQR